MEKNITTAPGLETSLADLHATVARLIRSIHDKAGQFERGQEILDKLPLLDFYNDDLLRNLDNIRRRR